MRGHIPVVTNEFKGLWGRGEGLSCPPDHMLNCNNVIFRTGSIESRNLWAVSNIGSPGGVDRVRRVFTYSTNSGDMYLIYLTVIGNLYTQKILPVSVGPLLMITLNRFYDIDVATFGGRAYIVTSNHGYVGSPEMYVFNGTDFRLAGLGKSADNAMYVTSFGTGIVDAGTRLIGYCSESASGFISPPTNPFPGPVVCPGNQLIRIQGATGPTGTVARRLVSTKAIPNFNGINDISKYPYYFIPGGRIVGNAYLTNFDINFTDSQLLEDVSYLSDIYEFPPGGSSITTYHNRLVIGAVGSGDKLHEVLISRVGDPESFEKADGVISIDPSSDVLLTGATSETLMTGITELQEYRDTLYAWKLNSTYGISDNGGPPASWPYTNIDQSNGSFRSGVVTILDSGGINIEYLIVANKTGLYTFNGLYNFPEISWKIKDQWSRISKIPADFTGWMATLEGKVYFVNDPNNRRLYCNVGLESPNPANILMVDYSETGITDPNYYMNVKWSNWTCDFGLFPMAIFAYDTGKGTQLLGFDLATVKWVEYEGTGIIKEVPTDNFTYFLSPVLMDKEESKVVHYGALTLNCIGQYGNPTPTIIYCILIEYSGRGGGKEIELAPFIVDQYNKKTKTILTNFSAQKIFYVLKGKFINLNSIQLWGKASYKTIPV